ncbi:peptide-methionine (R)-S-oxide reductase MsrB [Leifsonia xyli]|uniref:peptide-methionine (R)-S-oxide reductase MsrB n=1 Tax=Leifsonia xyli TaxID=1575 RepID=UPI003D6768F5
MPVLPALETARAVPLTRAQTELIASLEASTGGTIRTSAYDFETADYPELGHYSAVINGYEIGKIDYLSRRERIVLTTVIVVSSYRQQGIGTEFIANVLDDIRRQGRTVTVQCPVVAAFLRRFAQYMDMVDAHLPGDAFRLNTSAPRDEGRYSRTPEAIAMLGPMQYRVTQESATEPAFDNAYWNHSEPGLYVDIVSGEPLFASTHKFDSGSGWPTFNASVAPENLVLKYESIFDRHSTEVRSRYGDSHLGHIFTDGTPDDGCLRFVVNSAALRFVPVDQLKTSGYIEFGPMFNIEGVDS